MVIKDMEAVFGYSIPGISDQGECPVYGRGTYIFLVCLNKAALTITATAGDTLNMLVDFFTFLGIAGDFCESIAKGFCWDKLGNDLSLILKKRPHIHNQISNHRIVRQGLNDQYVFIQFLNGSPTCPAIYSVHPRGTGSTHSYTARISKSQRRVLCVLDFADYVEHVHPFL
jgi:hypothetical protein